MSVVPVITSNEKATLRKAHESFSRKAYLSGFSNAAATFLIIGALIVITSACLCLTIPGINVVSDVVLPGVVPGGAALLLSIPFLIITVKFTHQKKKLRNEEIHTMIKIFERHNFSKLEKDDKIDFIYKNFMPQTWTKEYRSSLIKDLKKRFPEEGENKTVNEAINEALDEVKKRVMEEGTAQEDE